MALGALNKRVWGNRANRTGENGLQLQPILFKEKFQTSLLGGFAPCVGIKTILNIVFEKVHAIRSTE